MFAVMTIREITPDDAEAAAKLSGELGYPVSTAAMRKRLEALHRLPDHVVYVACEERSVVAWIDIGVVHHLQAEPVAEIGGFVVSSEFRSRGIGRQLLAKTEQWARDRDLARIVVRSRVTREAAHRFYEREGYERIKTSAVFVKTLVLSQALKDCGR